MTAAPARRPRTPIPVPTPATAEVHMDLTDEVVADEPVQETPAIDLFDQTIKGKDRNEIQTTIADFTKMYGGHVLKMASQRARYSHIRSNVFTLDMGLHGGIPNSAISMVYGWESSGKTTLAMRLIAEAQRKHPDGVVALIDTEGTYDPLWGNVHGIDNDRLVLAQPDSGEQAVDLARALIKSLQVVMVVLDSLPALMPIKEMAKSAEDEVVALQARLIGRFVRAASQSLIDERAREHRPAVLLINQFRNKIAMMGDPRTLPGGNAIKFFVSVRWEVKNKEKLGKDKYDTEIVELNEHSWQITKNKIGNGIRNGEFTMIRSPDHALGAGFIDDAKHVATFARKFGLLTGGGNSWYLDGYMGLTDATKPMRFGKLDEVMDCLYSDLEYYENLKTRLISIQRVNNGLAGEGWM